MENNGLKTEHKSLRAYDGIKRVIEAVNIEAVLADFGKEDDSYWLHKNSKEAKKVIREVDEMREEYLKNNAHTSRYDTHNYDLVIKMDGKTEEEAANVILAFIG